MDLMITQMLVALLPIEIAEQYDLEKLRSISNIALAEIEAYCGRTFNTTDKGIVAVAARIAAIHIARQGTEGLASQSYSGVSESFIDGLPADIMAILDAKRVVKLF